MNTLKRTGKRALAMLLCMLLAVSIPLLPSQTASAAGWVTPYLEKMQSWDVVKGDPGGAMRTESPITRAEFVAMMNRAYGYTDLGPIPFTDVRTKDWFYDDIRKAYTAGIFKGTSNTTASPNALITREQAITLLARNMRMDEIPGEVIDFTDGRSFSDYSRVYVRAAVLAGIIDGYEDGTFKPQRNVTRGEAMKMMCVGIGSLINEPGEHAPGGVFGNLTINCTNVTLRDTIITGDLYISGGVSLGDVVLENVQVRGRIVIAGGGSSELGKNSVLLRGVDTSKLIVDAPTGQYISVLTEGRTHITDGLFRSDAFLEDGCRDGYGILNVSLEGASGDSFTLAGNLENVVNRTPDSTLILGDADAASVTIDEKATNSTLRMEVNAAADEVNLDVGTNVEGSGDIGHLVINSPGSSTSMLPDKITIRPGLKGDISGEEMDASQAQEYSTEPRILNGYPKVANVAPTEADGVASTNKQGTVYWGLTTAAMGPVPDTPEGQERLVSPSYGSGFLLSGNYKSESSNTEFTFPDKLKGLTSSGTYYVSAVLVDARGHRSPVYSQRFETPDNITPAFNNGYPRMLEVETDESWATVMANKKCDLYYVLLPQGSTQPTQQEFMSFGFVDPLGYGRVGLGKNKTESVQVNRVIYPNSTQEDKVNVLEEQVSYDLYLWLADADGIKSSNITKLTFTTRDKTPPEFVTDMQQTVMGATNIGVDCIINEPGTVYWAMVKTGENFPTPPKGHEPPWTSTTEEFLRDETAKIQVRNAQTADGGKVVKRGSIKANAGVAASTNITGLEKETAYDLYYIAVDNATPTGNYSDIVKKITVYTLDSTPPTAEVTFSRSATGTDNKPQPYADADVRIEFSENILYEPTTQSPLDLYNAGDKAKMADVLSKMIKMYQVNGGSSTEIKPNFNNAKVELNRSGKLIVTLPSGTDSATDAINMGSGCTYYFTFENIIDASPAQNRMKQDRTERFTTVSALAQMDEITATTLAGVSDGNGGNKALDIGFSIKPEATNSASSGTYWDLIMWLDTTSKFELYRRELRPDEDSNTSQTAWRQIGTEQNVLVSTDMTEAGVGLVRTDKPGQNPLPYLLTGDSNEALKEGTVYEFALHFTEMNNNRDRNTFNGDINCEVTVLAGRANNLSNIYGGLYKNNIMADVRNGLFADITHPNAFSVIKRFSDMTAPELNNDQITFTPGDSGVRMTLALKNNRIGKVHYVILKEGVFDPTDNSGHKIAITESPVTEGVGRPELTDATHYYTNATMRSPNVNNVISPSTMGGASSLSSTISNVGSATMPVEVDGLQASTTYYAYFVTQGGSNRYSDGVYVYKFKTLPITRPVLTLGQSGSNITVKTNLASTTEINYIIVPFSSQMGSDLFNYFGTKDKDDKYPSGGSNAGGIEKPGSTPKEYYRIFESMGTNASPSTDGSLFDQKATSALKENLSDYIRTQSPNSESILANGNGTATSGNHLVVDCSKPEFKLSYNQEYCFIAVGKSALSSATNPESYAFRAIYPFTLDDTEPPKVIEAIPNVKYDPVNIDALKKGQYFTGTVTLQFDKPLYLLDDTGINQTLKTVSAGTKDIGTGNYKNFVSAKNLIPVGGWSGATGFNVYTDPSQTPRAITSLTLDFTQATNNAAVTFDGQLCNASRHTRTPPLSIKIKLVRPNANSDYEAQVEISSGWKATATR